MAYLSKDNSGLVQLWSNKPEYNKYAEAWQAWIDHENNKNEVGIDVTNNRYFRHLFDIYDTPTCLDITLKVKEI